MYDTQTLETNKQWDAVDKEYEKRRLDMRNCTREFQEQQKKEKENRDTAESLWQDELGKQHINYCSNHDLFTENTQTCTSHVAPYRVLKYHWKGMDATQTNDIRLEQLRQAEDKKLREQMEKEAERMWAAQEEANRRNLLRVQREHDRQKAARVNDQVIEYNKLKAKEVERRDKILYDNVHAYK